MSGGELPEGWGEFEVGHFCDVALGKMLDREKRKRGTSLPYLRNANVQWGEIRTDDLLEMPFEDDELRMLPRELVDQVRPLFRPQGEV